MNTLLPRMQPEVGLVFWFGCLVSLGTAQIPAASFNTNDWAFFDNGEVRIGVKKTSGACIGYFSLSDSTRNLLNHHDQGRFIQQSFYGDEDGTLWNKQPWRWNPVQGGDWKGNPARLLEFKIEPNSIYARSMGRHWSGCVDLPDVIFEEWITLTGRVAHIRYRMTYTAEQSHAIRDHEIPAVFVEPDLDTLVLYDGDEPWTGGALSRSRPGWPNESRRFSEQWAAYVDQHDFGIGVYVPTATNLTCYRFGEGGSARGACSYFAPLIRLAVTPGLVIDSDVYVAIGSSGELREQFSRIRRAAATAAPTR
jgi:hypothetical protein